MRVHTSKLNRHKHDPVPTRPFKRELDRLIRRAVRDLGTTSQHPAARKFLPYMRAQVQRRFTK